MKIAVVPTLAPPAFVLSARPFILTCLTCGPGAAFGQAETVEEAEQQCCDHAEATQHRLDRIYFDRAWGFAPAAVTSASG